MALERIIDYIKSWFYYPKMKKYFDDRKMSGYNHWNDKSFARFKYAWWHCHVGKLKKIRTMEDWLGKNWKTINRVKNIGDCKEPIETTAMPEWYCKFNQEPIKSE